MPSIQKNGQRDLISGVSGCLCFGGGYWRHDYKYAFSIIRKIKPENLIDIGY